MRHLAALFLLALATAVLHADDWPQWLGPQRDGVWREKGILTQFPQGGLKPLWRVPIGGGYAGPAVADGLVYVPDRQLDPGQKDPANPFLRTNSKGKERIVALDAKTGKQVWVYEYPCTYTMSYPAGPRTTPVIQDGKLWSLGAMGDLVCLDAKKGEVIWTKNLVKEYDAGVPVWGFAAHLLVEGDTVISLVAKKPVVVAFDKNTGKEKWRALEIENAEIGYCPPTLLTLGGKRQLIIWHPEAVNGLEPASGKLLWSYPWTIRSNLSVSTPRAVGKDQLFLTAFYNGSRLLEVKADQVKEVWRSKGRDEKDTQAIHSIMPTPFIEGTTAYGVCSYGQLRAIDLQAGGKRLWEDLTATGAMQPQRWANAFLTPHGERYFLFNEKGDLIIARLTPKGYTQRDKAHLIDPTSQLAGGLTGPRKVVWSHPAYANKTIYVRNDKEIAAFYLGSDSE